ncbi:fibronectin type III domain-containing protein [Actinokineospora iranica]|uniref:Fibronectin type III domain-containing protein n=1 Tax=Actinokineospora iranica TaxID=1271860 RepID=A0A1G6P0K3_9PSEU|nr:fibronectin type III domain-containing protein [Actinokineospora iranica]SDC73026.1 Fibronectin type III domain-containing protein [Actinokineospora iranica]
MTAAGLVALGGAIVVLRTPDEPGRHVPQPAPPPQTAVREFAGEDVVIPGPGAKPAPPERVAALPGSQRLRLRWAPPAGGVAVAGYEVKWGRASAMEHVRLVAEPAAQLNALTDNIPYSVEIRSVDSYGQRSAPATVTAVPAQAPDDLPWSFQDRFVSRVVPDPVGWRFSSTTDCARATRGAAEDGDRLVVSGQCAAEPVALRSRVPLRLRATPVDGELGRVVVSTDHPGHDGELTLTFVPGPVDLIGGSPSGSPSPGKPGLAQDDPSLPPGTVRMRVVGRDAAVRVLVAPGTPRLGRPVAVQPVPRAEIGFSVRWEVVFRTDGIRVLRDGVLVGAGDVVPDWRAATALLGFVGGGVGLHAAVDLVGFVGAPTVRPVLVVPPRIDADRVVAAPDTPLVTPGAGARVAGATGGQLRVTLVPQAPGADAFTVEAGGREYPARPAVAGQPFTRGVRYPIVADLPPEALVLGPDGKTLPVRVRGPVLRETGPTRVISASMELTAPEGAVSPAAGTGIETPLPRVKPAPARPSAAFFDVAAKPIAADTELPRGRVVLEVRADGLAGQRQSGRLAGMAGVEVRIDGQRVAGIPTVADGPGVGGRWRLALTTKELAAGRHTVEVKVVGVDPGTAFAVAYAPFRIGA